MTIAQPRTVPNTRELRALQLYRTRGHEIRQVDEDLYLVPELHGSGLHSVDYRKGLRLPRLRTAGEGKHILAVGVHVARDAAAPPGPMPATTAGSAWKSRRRTARPRRCCLCRRCAERS